MTADERKVLDELKSMLEVHLARDEARDQQVTDLNNTVYGPEGLEKTVIRHGLVISILKYVTMILTGALLTGCAYKIVELASR